MKRIIDLPAGTSVTPEVQDRAAEQLRQLSGLEVYAASVTPAGGFVLALVRQGRDRRLLAAGQRDQIALANLTTEWRRTGREIAIAIAPLSHEAAVFLRTHVPWTAPRLCGLATSVGLGDRLGLATPGHLRAVQGSGCVPFPAQQSIREMTRTHRSPENVMDDATWGVFQAGWREGFGSDADHLKTTADIDATARAGFTLFTLDPGDHVCSEADTMTATAAARAAELLPWDDLETTESDTRKRYLSGRFAIAGGGEVGFTEEALLRAVVKYGRAIAHTVRMYRHLLSRRGRGGFELEVSVDETDSPTSEAEHCFIAAELKRLAVKWVSLAPRFIGRFEKGVDYKGDWQAFEQSYARHAAIARTLGPYKLSLHSGSDKFSIYPIAARVSQGLVHLKTAGTSYLEALRVIARVNPGLFRRILDFAFEQFDADRASYQISARVEDVPRSEALSDDRLETVLDCSSGRQLLHVTYGSVLTATEPDGRFRFRDELLETLRDHEEEHYAVLAAHIRRHVWPFAQG